MCKNMQKYPKINKFLFKLHFFSSVYGNMNMHEHLQLWNKLHIDFITFLSVIRYLNFFQKKKKKGKKYLFLSFIECPILLPIIIVKHFISNSILREIAQLWNNWN